MLILLHLWDDPSLKMQAQLTVQLNSRPGIDCGLSCPYRRKGFNACPAHPLTACTVSSTDILLV